MAIRARVLKHPAVLPPLVYLLLASLLFRAGWASPSIRNIGGPDDTLFTMWALRWTPHALTAGNSPLFTDHLNFPYGVNMMWNGLAPLYGLVLWPVSVLSGLVVPYNVLVTMNVVLTAWCGYLAMRVFVASRWAASVGGLLYGFSPYMMAQSLDHPTLTAGYVPALLLLVLHEVLVRQEHSAVRVGALLGLLAAAQLFIAEEGLAIQAVVATLGLLVLVLMNRSMVTSHARYTLRAMGTATAVFLLTTGWALWFQFSGPQRLRGGTAQPPNFFVNDLANFVVPTKVQQLAPQWAVHMSGRWSGNPSEWDAYLGVPLIVLATFVVFRLRARPVVRWAGALAALTGVLSLGPNLHLNGHDTGIPLPWRAFEPVPLLNHILPARLAMFTFLMVSIVVAVGVDHALKTGSWRRVPQGAAMGVTATAIAVSLMPDLTYPSTRVNVPRFFTGTSVQIVPEGSVALIAPFQQLFPADPMAWQAAADMRFKMPQGYFFVPDEKGHPSYGAPASHLSTTMYQAQAGGHPQLTPDVRAAIADDLAERQVETVIVGPMRHQTEMVELFEDLFDVAPDRYGDTYVWPQAQRLLR